MIILEIVITKNYSKLLRINDIIFLLILAVVVLAVTMAITTRMFKNKLIT